MSTQKDIADELAEKQRKISVSEFFEENKHMLGFDSQARSLVTAVKEGVDNALDVCEEMGVLPEVYVDIEKVEEGIRITIEDNGPGIPESNVGDVYGSILFGSRFGRPIQKRGQQGVGISAAVMYSQLTTNKPARITTITPSQEKAYRTNVGIDTDNNEPLVTDEERIELDKDHGTEVVLTMKANLRARKRLIEYLENTSIANPHARISYNGIRERRLFDRSTEEMPRDPEPIKPHPHGIQDKGLREILQDTDSYSLKGCLRDDFSKVGNKTAEDMISNFKDIHYGRIVPLSVKKDIEETVEDAVSGKKEEDVQLFIEKINEKLDGLMTEDEIQNAVHQASEEIDKTFGDTVCSNTVDALVSIFSEGNYVHELIEEATTSRKDDQAVEELSDIVFGKLEEHVTKEELEDIVESSIEGLSSEETFGDKSIEKIVEKIWSVTKTKDVEVPKVKEILEDERMISSLNKALQQTQVSRPSSKCLSPIGPSVLEKSLRDNYPGEFYATSIRDAGSHQGSPFLVEAGLVFAPDKYSVEENIEIDRYANRVPLVYQQGACSITKVIKNIDWLNYRPSKVSLIKQSGGRGIPQGPFALFVHVASTNVPFTSESKDAIAGSGEIEHEIEQAIRDVARDLRDHLSQRKERQKRKKKRKQVLEVMPDLVEKFSEIADREAPDWGFVSSNITDSILLKKREDSIGVYNKIGTRRKIRIVLEGVSSLPDDSDFVEDDGEYVWEKVVHSSNQFPDIKVGTEYDDIRVEEIDKDTYLEYDMR